MPTSAPLVDVIPQVREAFDEACVAVFNNQVQRPLLGCESNKLLLGFAAHYQRLRALPRRTRRSIERRWKRTLSAIALLMTLGQAPAWAAIIEVSPGTPPAIISDGRCSLSEAIINANANAATHRDCVPGAGPDTIVLPATSQQQLQGAATLPPITSQIVIEGRDSTINRNAGMGLAFLSVEATGNLTLNKTIVSGAGSGNRGLIGISNTGRLTLNDSSLANLDDGGLKNRGGVAIITDSRITGNSAGYYSSGGGGGIANLDGGRLTVTNSVISGNGGYFKGGGIFNGTGSSATLTNSIVSDNRITYEGSGGGIENYGTLVLLGTTVAGNEAQFAAGIVNRGTATIRRSTISGNRIAHQYDYQSAGGIGNLGTLTLVNSTVSGNEARANGGGITNGSNGILTLVSSTVTGNAVTADVYYQNGGGLAVFDGTLTLQRSIVSGNKANTSSEIWAGSDAVVKADDFNLFGHDGDAGVVGFTPGATDVVPNKPVSGILLPLADNGGETRTHALAIGSPALNASPDDANCPTIDQRSNPRPQGPACDIGSFEGSAVLCGGRVTTMVGTNGPDSLSGTPGADVIGGLGGNDAIVGLQGNDVICAGGGADRVYGGPGNDVLSGQSGDDRLFGQGGNDTLDGGPGQDQCDGGSHTGAGDTAAACETVSNVP